MNAQEFLESGQFNNIAIRGDYYTISRHSDGNWLVHSHIDMNSPLAEYVEFNDAANAYNSLEQYQRMVAVYGEEEAQRMATQAAKQVRRGGFVVNREVD